MGPTQAVGTRRRLLAAAGVLLERDGPDALKARALADAIGMSTMAVYQHFSGLAGVVEELCREGAVAFAAHVDAVPETDDAAADLCARGLAYRAWARGHPQLYRLMHGLTGGTPVRGLQDLTRTGTPSAQPEAQRAFDVLVRSVRRVQDAGRIRRDDPVIVAAQVWSTMHGYVLLEIAGVFGDDAGAAQVVAALGVNLLVGLGDDRAAAEASAMAAFASTT